MGIDLGIVALFQQIGVPSSAFDPKFNTVYGDKQNYRTNAGNSGTAYYAKDLKGREYYLPVTVSYPDNDGTLVQWDLPYPVVSVQSKKLIIETPLTERRGTVKEYIQIEDYSIRIRGFLINNDANELPENDMQTMRDIFEVGTSIGIKNVVTDVFLMRTDRKGSDQVVVKSLDFPEIVGVKGVRPYVLELLSDEPFTLTDIS